MCRLVTLYLLLAAATYVMIAELVSRQVERKQRHVREAEEVAATAWNNGAISDTDLRLN